MAINAYESKILSFERGLTVRGNASIATGKWYWEITIDHGQYRDSVLTCVGVGTGAVLPQQAFAETIHGWGIDAAGRARHGGFGSSEVLPGYSNSTRYGKVTVGIAIDMDSGYLWTIVADEWGKYDNVGDPVAGTDPHISDISGTVYPMVSLQTFSDDKNESVKITGNFGKLPFEHIIPEGYSVLVGPSSSSSLSSSSSSISSSSSSMSFSSSSFSVSFSSVSHTSGWSSSSSSVSFSSSLSFSSISYSTTPTNLPKIGWLTAQVEAEEDGEAKIGWLTAQVETSY